MNKTTALVEVGTSYTFNGLSINENATHTGTATQTSTTSSITGMKYGCATTAGGEVDKTVTSLSASATTATATYTTNFDTATATVTLDKVSGFTGIEDASAQVVVNNNTLSLSDQTGTTVEGENKLTLAWSNTAAVSRTISGDAVAKLGTVYYASNKYNTSSSKSATVNAVNWTDKGANATGVSYTTTQLVVKAVYPYYTNGK